MAMFGNQGWNMPDPSMGTYAPQTTQMSQLAPVDTSMPPPTIAPVAPAPAAKEGGGWKNVMGIISDGILAGLGKQPVYMPIMDKRRQEQDALNKQSTEQQNEFQRQLALYQYKLANPTNDTVNDYNFWQSHLSPQDFATYVQNKVNPPQYRQGPDGAFYRIDTPQTAPAAPKPIGATLPPGWTVDGGPTQPASGGFQR